MTKRDWYGILGVGVLIALTLTAAGCSAQTQDAPALAESEQITRNIKVYESPT